MSEEDIIIINYYGYDEAYVLKQMSPAEKAELISNQFVLSTKAQTTLPDGTMRQGSTPDRICFANPGNALSVEEWKAQWDAQPIELLFELAQPVTYALSPRQLMLLQGQNALWCDAGETRVTYVTDTKAYIDERLAAIAAGIA